MLESEFGIAVARLEATHCSTKLFCDSSPPVNRQNHSHACPSPGTAAIANSNHEDECIAKEGVESESLK
jgi:hypothetical protein